MIAYSLIDDNINGEKFRDFIAYCLQYSTFFSLTSHNLVKNSCSQIIQELNGFLYKSFQTDTWFCYKMLGRPIDISLYHSNLSSLDSIVKHFQQLFPSRLQGIEDICFLKDERLLFGSVTHEGIAQLYLSSESELSDYVIFASWKRVILSPRDYEYLPDIQKFL